MRSEAKQQIKKSICREVRSGPEREALSSRSTDRLDRPGIPSAFQVGDGLSGVFNFLSIPILVTLYLYMACRLGSFVGRLSRSYPADDEPAYEAWELTADRG